MKKNYASIIPAIALAVFPLLGNKPIFLTIYGGKKDYRRRLVAEVYLHKISIIESRYMIHLAICIKCDTLKL